jgi:hypothetical protein
MKSWQCVLQITPKIGRSSGWQRSPRLEDHGHIPQYLP